ncbi:hypothetical protein ACFVT1_13535 [Streptomyces sp. NPDC057963]|uniref:hypothetical protein n=1 Tax=Streptomyces sp. NPDC057963 TaxID=3346290 RepID=UPI0036E4AD3B
MTGPAAQIGDGRASTISLRSGDGRQLKAPVLVADTGYGVSTRSGLRSRDGIGLLV